MLCNDYCDTDARVAFLYLYFCENKNEKGKKKKKMSVESPLILQPRVEDSILDYPKCLFLGSI